MTCAALHVSSASAEPENGWWWNPDESGRGFFIEATGGVFYVGGYFYEADGRTTWLSSGGVVTDPYRYASTLQAYRDGQTMFGNYRAPTHVDVGPMVVQFDTDTSGTITWPGGVIPIQRHVFGTGAAPFQPETGWWWNEAESGRGYSVEVQGPNAFVVAFMYDEGGNPVWHFSAGPMATATRYDGDWLQFSGGQTLAGPYRPPHVPQKIGRLAIDFTTPSEAMITLSDAVVAKAGASNAVKLGSGPTRHTRQLARSVWAQPADHWPFWNGTLSKVATQNVGTLTQTEEIRITNVRWVGNGTQYQWWRDYELSPNAARVTITFHQEDLFSGCVTDGQFTYPLNAGYLTVFEDGRYSGRLGDPNVGTILDVPVAITCPDAPPQFYMLPRVIAEDFGVDPNNPSMGFYVNNFYSHAGRIRSYTPQIVSIRKGPIPGGERTVSWNFVADFGSP
jgi:hypothetical protein